MASYVDCFKNLFRAEKQSYLNKEAVAEVKRRIAIDQTGSIGSLYDTCQDQIMDLTGERRNCLKMIDIDDSLRLNILLKTVQPTGTSSLIDYPRAIDEHTRMLYIYLESQTDSCRTHSVEEIKSRNPFISETLPTHEITKIICDAHAVVVVRLLPNQLIELDNLLDEIHQSLIYNESTVGGYRKKKNLVDQIISTTCYSNIHDLTRMTILTSKEPMINKRESYSKAISNSTKRIAPSAPQSSIDYKYINILLLGESGVDKSTFISAFANYLTSYVFGFSRGKLFRIIDTPGFGDTRDLSDDDKKDFEKSWLQSVQESNRLQKFISEDVHQPYRRSIEWQSTKEAQLQINLMIRPILEAIRSTFRNILLHESNCLIKLSATCVGQSTTIFYTCESTVKKFRHFWILIDHFHSLPNTQQSPTQYRLDYKLMDEQVDMSIDTLNEQHQFLCEASIKMIDEEQYICRSYDLVNFNQQLIRKLKQLQREYEQQFNRTVQNEENQIRPHVYQLVTSVNEIPMIRTQIDAIKKYQEGIFKSHENKVEQNEAYF
ncbi:unnamed protein product [Rotaria socialis]|uniref:Uncharacterized protein n=1 Tax=Rotaria socialis TaxID=392032 RepID=A0A821V3M6_9BILA|nr:unnamed protein product [Rotaria socialis]